jgi:putative membrane protein
MVNSGWFSMAWHWHPSVIVGCVALLVGYGYLIGYRRSVLALSFSLGVVVLFVALLSPLHTLGDSYLFSAHMAQHLLLVQVVAPLLLMGVPAEALRPLWASPSLRRMERVLGRPLVAWSVGVWTMWIWHLPFLYNAALAYELVHVLEHLCFLGSALIFWWPLLNLSPRPQLAAIPALAYLFTAMAAGSVLGMILTFAQPGLYPEYLDPIDTLGILPMIRGEWGLSPAADQQLGGLLMWMPGGLAYLCAMLGVLARWFEAEKYEQARRIDVVQ